MMLFALDYDPVNSNKVMWCILVTLFLSRLILSGPLGSIMLCICTTLPKDLLWRVSSVSLTITANKQAQQNRTDQT